ncbi:LAME_0G05732g1_1 [Lachancea meyersii CBS 8951]|uniref:LAME_0G05732g1_1 n=1 Tax=Lachancea meyersii CBS 8951 TaxID=1266667 RepID=A0A1G4K799_9SACH|nr:LAME_0G05732g1_1 [Lachancea meyersii CBS 8951]
MLDELPVEIKLELLKSHLQLAFVNKQWYRLSNRFYRDCCLSLKPKEYWDRIQDCLCRYVHSLDEERKAARLINAALCGNKETGENDVPYMSDSWQIIYSVLFRNPRFFAMDSASRELNITHDVVTEYYCPMELESGKRYPCNLWCKKATDGGFFGVIRVAIYGQPDGSEPLLVRDLALTLDDWCQDSGAYCLFGGHFQLAKSANSLQIVHMGVSITNAANVVLEAVDTTPYQGNKSWLLFRTQQLEVFNRWEKLLSAERMRWDEKFVNATEDAAKNADFEFVYRFPKDLGACHGLKSVWFPRLQSRET